ncbi:MAG: ABC transporter substrate-binding protein [Clostridia bacterium]|nr:ABC transporter substrate-binding protein [Clostridia bacterium]
MLRKLTITFIGLIFLVGLLLAGCSSSSQPDRGDNGPVGDTNRDELVLALSNTEPDEGFDPTTGWGRYGSPLFQSTLLKRDSQLKITYDLATGYSVSDDGLTWTVDIRDDVLFSDGTPLTAEDVAYTFETAKASGSTIDLTYLDSAEAVDEYTVVFKLKHPQSTFISRLIQMGIVPKHAHGPDYGQAPIGSGPYQFVQWDKGQQLIVTANPHYYGEKPYFQKLTFLFLGEDAAFAAAKAGQVDIASIPPAFAKQPVPGMKLVVVDSVDNRGISFPMVPAGQLTTDEGFPVGNDVTADIAIRKAINVAIDRQELIDGILEGYGTPAYTICDEMPWWNPETVIDDGDEQEAGRILAEAGWQDLDGDGILEKGDIQARLTLIYPSSDKLRQSLAIAVSDKLKDIGIEMQAEGKSWDEIARLSHSNPVLYGWGDQDPLEMYNIYSSKMAGVGSYNPGFYSNPIVDEYMEQAMAALSEEEAIQYWQKAQWDGETGLSAKGDAPWAWLVNNQHLYLVRDNLDLGTPKIEPHGHGFPITDNIVTWRWRE